MALLQLFNRWINKDDEISNKRTQHAMVFTGIGILTLMNILIIGSGGRDMRWHGNVHKIIL